MEYAIACSQLVKQYGRFSLLLSDFHVQKGTVHGLVGANGSGKTTTLKLLLGLLRKDGGDCVVLGSENIGSENRLREQIGFMIEEASVPSLLNPKQLGRVLSHCYSGWDAVQFGNLLDAFHLDADKPYHKCSRGMKVKIQLAIALSHQASLLILDEPTSGLDPLARDEIVTMLSEYSRRSDRTILISSHITSDLEKLCDYVTFLEMGKIRFTQEKDTLLDEYRLVQTTHARLADFDRSAILGKRENAFNVELLMQRKHIPDFAQSQRCTLEDVIILLSKGGDWT
ncbi:ABC transporter ATP-binding protein [Sphaerochaeta sp.]|uniref:ABC transporter ATP-binding protein n=1 Tax=Sphaerochaeta sp. TaxID=1972642 RepID=UPI002FC79F5C